MYDKLLDLKAGSREHPVYAQVEFTGELTPSVAIEAARRAFGHADGVTVTDPKSGLTYRVRSGKARKLPTDPAYYYDDEE